MAIKHIVFDFGGVLVDWNPRHFYKTIFSSDEEMEDFLAHVCTSEWNIEQDRGRSLAEATSIKIKEFPDKEELIRMYYGEWVNMLNGPIQENVDVLLSLKGKYGLFGLTNWSAETFPTALELFPFFEVFEGKIVVSGEEKLIKPDPAIFHVLLDRYNLNTQECMFIDDNYDNIRAAQELGFYTVHCVPGLDLASEINILAIS